MSIKWVYFSDKNTPPGELQSLLEKDQFHLMATNQIEELHNILNEEHQPVLFINTKTQYNDYDFCWEISVNYPHVYIILIVPDHIENLKKAMQMGASDLLRYSYNFEELTESIEQAKRYMNHQVNGESKIFNPLKEKSKVIAVSSPKGGIGRTLITVNIATAMARMGKKVAIIDANLQFGEVSTYFDVKPKRTIYEWVKEGYGKLNYSINQYLTIVDGDVSILAAPPRPEFFEGILDAHMKAAIEEASKQFDVVLIDMPVHLSEIHLACLDLADEILLLAVNEISVLRLTQLYLDTLESINLKGKAKLVFNRFVKGQGLALGKIEEILKMVVFDTVPEQTNIASSSVKSGQPFIISNSRSHLGKAVWKLSEKLIMQVSDDLSEVKKEKRWQFSRKVRMG